MLHRRRLGGAVLAVALGFFVAPHVQAATPSVAVVHVAVVNDSTADALRDALNGDARAIVLEIDSAGGKQSSMERMLNLLNASPKPVLAEVPSGAVAQDAALILAEKADVLGVAPGARIGAPHAMSAGNAGALASSLASLRGRDSVWVYRALNSGAEIDGTQAAQQRISDTDSADTQTLLAFVDGRALHGSVLHTGVALTTVTPGGLSAVINQLAVPDAAYLLLMITMAMAILWFGHPGNVLTIAGGVIAATLTAISMSDLPIQPLGIVLIVAAVGIFVIDMSASTHGALTAVGATLMVVGGWQLIDTSAMATGVNLGLIALSVGLVTAAYAVVVPRMVALRRLPHSDPTTQWIGSQATVAEDLDPAGMVRLQGSLWQATSESGPAIVGQSVEVTAVQGLHLTVRASRPPGRDWK